MTSRALRSLLATAAASIVLATLAPAAHADPTYPNRPVRVLVGFGAGSGTDILARIVAAELAAALKQPFVVENRPGASAMVAAQAAVQAPPDGYTLFFSPSSPMVVNPHVFKTLPYDPLKDFTAIGGVGNYPWLLAVDAKLPVHTPQELVSYAKANKGKVNFAYGTSAVRVPVEALNNLLELGASGVSYKGSPDAMVDVIGGRVHFLVVDLAAAQTHLQAGRLRALAVTMSKRTGLAPDLPTVEETLGLQDFDLSAFAGLFGPANMPKDLVDKLSAAMMQALAKPEVRRKIVDAGAEVAPLGPAEMAAVVRRSYAIWGKKVADAGIRPE
ncbi:MAG: Bug family tripartite tricarboxylate transporter substrate binding protein [Lautropia sp.]